MNQQRCIDLDATAALEQELFELRHLTTKEVEESWAEVTRLHDVCSSKDQLIQDLQATVKNQRETILEYESKDNAIHGSGGSSGQDQSSKVDIQYVSPQESKNDLSACELATAATAKAVTGTTVEDQGSVTTMGSSRHRRLSLKSLKDSLHESYSRICFQDGGSDHNHESTGSHSSDTTQKNRDLEELQKVKRNERTEELEIKLQQRESAIENLEQALMNQTRLVQKLREELDDCKLPKVQKSVNHKNKDTSRNSTLMRSQSVRQTSKRRSLMMQCEAKDDFVLMSKSEHKPGAIVEYPSLLVSNRRTSQTSV
mmetsp:Transcript_25348/g.35546  ORF Transcript_25348/g.35546 Transcript_25348/m.35546 type:complete len:313 (-) Transcript_25348:84-1022(-)